MQIAAGRTRRSRFLKSSLAAALVPAWLALGAPAYALSDLQPATPPAADAPTATAPAATAPAATDTKPAATSAAPAAGADQTKVKGPVEVSFDITKAPAAVQKTRQEIIDAATAGDVKKIAALLKANQTDLGPDNANADPESALKDMSGDGDGLEVLSIMLDVLSTGYAHVGAGTANDMYVWPYFTQKDVKTLTPAEKVDLMRLVTAGDFADMQEYGSYNFYRVGIAADGKWKQFTSGN
ncbi:MAG TPA: hypothetical protein VE079_00370 [Ensifer sp.]|nr:hypothetical protein [Ensifer sp.]